MFELLEEFENLGYQNNLRTEEEFEYFENFTFNRSKKKKDH